MGTEGELRAVAFKEGDVWVVQGIEFDLVAQTTDPLDAPRAFLKTLINTILINHRLGRSGLENIKPAPDRFREMFENADVELSPAMPASEEQFPRPNISLRAYRQQEAI